MNKITILDEFKKNLIIFLDELISQFPQNKDLVAGRILVKDVIPIITIVNYIIQHILPYKEYVKKRDDNFFLNNNTIYDQVDKDTVNNFKKIWRSTSLDNEDRKILWKWIDTFVFLIEKYQSIN